MFFGDILHENMLWILLSVGIIMIFQHHEKFKLQIPPQLLYMSLGIFIVSLGYSIPPEIKMLSALAVIFMLFTSELTSHNVPKFFESIGKNIKVAIIAGIGPWSGAFLFSYLWGWSMTEGVVLGAVFTATALPFTIGVLKEFNILQTKAAKTAISASTADDILATLVGILTSIILGSNGSNLDYSHVTKEVLLVIGFFIFIYILHYILSEFGLLKRYKGGALSIIIIGGGIIAIGESIFGVHYAIAALLAGVLLNPDFFHSKLSNFSKASESLAYSSIYIGPFFFLYLGLNLNMNDVFNQPVILLSGFLLFLTVLFFQFTSAFLSGKLRKLDNKNATILGFAMAPRDVVAIVILDMNIRFISDTTIFTSVLLAIFLLNISATLGLKWSSSTDAFDKKIIQK